MVALHEDYAALLTCLVPGDHLMLPALNSLTTFRGVRRVSDVTLDVVFVPHEVR